MLRDCQSRLPTVPDGQNTLKYQLADDGCAPDELVERLGEAGCDDALVGIGQPGRLALEFTRDAPDAVEAVLSALSDVRRAVPSARLIEVAPDLVGGDSKVCVPDEFYTLGTHCGDEQVAIRSLP